MWATISCPQFYRLRPRKKRREPCIQLQRNYPFVDVCFIDASISSHHCTCQMSGDHSNQSNGQASEEIQAEKNEVMA